MSWLRRFPSRRARCASGSLSCPSGPSRWRWMSRHFHTACTPPCCATWASCRHRPLLPGVGRASARRHRLQPRRHSGRRAGERGTFGVPRAAGSGDERGEACRRQSGYGRAVRQPGCDSARCLGRRGRLRSGQCAEWPWSRTGRHAGACTRGRRRTAHRVTAGRGNSDPRARAALRLWSASRLDGCTRLRVRLDLVHRNCET